jgi:Glycosyl hydrolases family 16
MKAPLLSFSIALCTIALAANLSADQQLGAQVRTKEEFGYGELLATIKLSTEPGIINGIFMLKFHPGPGPQDWSWGWTEIDYEYVPGNHDAWRRTAANDCGPNSDSCTQGKLGNQSAANFISVNVIGGPLGGGPKPDSQVFYELSQPYLETANTYRFEFTPDQVKWATVGLNQGRPFMYQKSGNNNDDIHQSLGMQYLVGRKMFIWLNCYSGLGYEGSFGGTGVIPRKDTEMVVERVAFYPLIDGAISSIATMSSDFVHGKYFLEGKVNPNFGDIWLNEDSKKNPIYTRAANASVVPGKGLVMKYTYRQ